MSNIHVLDQSGGGYRLVFHVATPVGNNAAAVPWAIVLLNSGYGGTSAMKAGDGTAGTISAAELSSVQSGNTIEVPCQFSPSADFEAATGLQQKTFIDALYAQVTGNELTRLQRALNRWGATLA